MRAIPGCPVDGRIRRRRLKELRRQCEYYLAELNIPELLDIDGLCTHLGESRGRPIHLLPMELHRARVYGIWVSLKEADYIAYEKHTSVAHQSHIIAHELSHILCDHRAGGQGDSGLAELFPNLDPDLVQGMLLRCGYTQDAEQEAEIMASLLLLRAQHRTTELSWGPPPEDVETLARIEGVIGLGTLDEAKEGEPSPPRDGGIAR